jgi:hypothetical protein
MSDIKLDGFTSIGAEQLAARLRKYWADRGYRVHAWAERFEIPKASDKSQVLYCVRSSLINGLPPVGA